MKAKLTNRLQGLAGRIVSWLWVLHAFELSLRGLLLLLRVFYSCLVILKVFNCSISGLLGTDGVSSWLRRVVMWILDSQACNQLWHLVQRSLLTAPKGVWGFTSVMRFRAYYENKRQKGADSNDKEMWCHCFCLFSGHFRQKFWGSAKVMVLPRSWRRVTRATTSCFCSASGFHVADDGDLWETSRDSEFCQDLSILFKGLTLTLQWSPAECIKPQTLLLNWMLQLHNRKHCFNNSDLLYLLAKRRD